MQHLKLTIKRREISHRLMNDLLLTRVQRINKMEDNSKGDRTRPTLSALRLLVSPIRLVTAAVWQTIQQKVVANYGMLEEFVSMVTDIVPELLTTRQKVQLTLGLRARLVLELCQFEATPDFEAVRPHLDRMQNHIEAWVVEAGATNEEVPNSDFVDVVKTILKDPEKREDFFQKVFPEKFGPTFDEALHSLTWLLLFRLEKLLPLQTFQQVASMFDEASSVLEDCMESVSQYEELRIVLQYQKDLSQLDHNDGSLDGACITSALKLPSAKTTETQTKQAQATILDDVLSCTSNLEEERLALPLTAQLNTDTFTEHHTIKKKTDKTNWTPGENETGVAFDDITRREENADHLQSQADDAAGVKQCCVQQSLQLRPIRRNRGLRLKKILLKEKRGLCDRALPVCKPASRKVKSPSRAPQEVSDDDNSIRFGKDSSYMAPITNCSEDDSWSYYSDEDSFHNTTSGSPSMADSWSDYLDDSSSFSSVSSPTGYDSVYSCPNEDPAFMGPKVLSALSRKQGTGVKASAQKKIRQVYCFICKKHVDTSLRSHMKTHFTEGYYACPRCDSRFKLFSSFKMHVRRTCYEYGKQQVDPEKLDEAKNLYKCDKCQEAFRYKVSLDRHKLTHDELYCSVCRKVLRDTAALARHKISHTAFQCTRCEETFTLFMPLIRHYENIHKISRPFKCNRCPKTLTRLRFLILHEWTHTGHLPFKCAQCSCRFKSDADLIYHERVHTKEKPYLCPECGKTFSQNSNLLRHLNLIHDEGQKDKRHSCSQCEKSFKEKGALKKHQRSKHLNELFRHPCPYCGKMVSKSTLARHKLIHTGERPFKCTVPECDKFFRSTSEMKKHVLIQHTTERPYKCDVCGKGFVKMCFLRAHARIHSGEKPFVCHICGKAFPKLYSMQRHRKLIHTFVPH
ncbi:zinc finger protein 287-like isoform X1 [Paralichthys olivaceus]|uniref:zinc finger protein 287-like isoform X1 n=1 Tax=Paralichthys olivaceus TaxID=8255 RepID=UPI003753BAB5